MPLTLLEVKMAMLSKLAGSLLAADDAAKLKLTPLTATQVVEHGYPIVGAGFEIPYFDLQGKLIKFKRLRYLEDTSKGFDKLSGRKALRYTQLSGTAPEVYYPPLTNWSAHAANIGIPLVITEGELKAASATKVGIPTIGLGGVWSFKSNKKGEGFLKSLKQIVWAARKVIIAYDSDASTNPLVIAAENALAAELTELGADVHIARLLSDEAGVKVGLDDYLLTHDVYELKALLEEAPAYAASKALHALSEEVVYVRDPGFIYDYTNSMRISVDSFLKHAYANYWYEEQNTAGKVVKIQTAAKWLQWPMRAELTKVTFAPGESKITNNCLNQWAGWAYEPVKGDIAPWKKLLDHIFQGAEKGVREWFEQWCAYPIQYPGYKLASGVLCWGIVHGSGKTMIGHILMELYRGYSAEIKDSDIMSPDFEWAENKQFVLADDITSQDNRLLKRRLMTMITQKEIPINVKYVPRYRIPDCINYYFTSNDPDAFYMDDGDRRFFIHEVIVDKLPLKLRDDLKVWKSTDKGMCALMHHLATLDLSGFDPDAEAYPTLAKQTMQNLTKGDLAAWVAELRVDPESKLKMKGDLFTAAELLMMYDPLNLGKVTKNGLARELTRAGIRPAGASEAMAVTAFGNVRLYAVRNRPYWAKQKAKTVVQHYEAHRVMLPIGVRRKF